MNFLEAIFLSKFSEEHGQTSLSMPPFICNMWKNAFMLFFATPLGRKQTHSRGCKREIIYFSSNTIFM